jgi:hypothetical protein
MTRKENVITALIGSVIGLVLGYFMSVSMLEDAEKCKVLVEENRMLQQMIMECQGD